MIESIYIFLSALYLNFTIALHLVSIIMELTGVRKEWVKTERSGNISVNIPRA